MMTQGMKNRLYLGHALIIWAGGLYQIIHIFHYKSAEDITLFWVGCLLASELLALPRAFDSLFLVWKACHVISAVLITLLLMGVILYR